MYKQESDIDSTSKDVFKKTKTVSIGKDIMSLAYIISVVKKKKKKLIKEIPMSTHVQVTGMLKRNLLFHTTLEATPAPGMFSNVK